ncbi:MAG TPA: hypothetical protein VMW15_10875 [Terracidiphilus sp.]|nr:hypothetical protein [Terracidiphilus sp.]
MEAYPIGTTEQFCELRMKALRVSLFMCPFVIALPAPSGLHEDRGLAWSLAERELQTTVKSMQGVSAHGPAPESQTKQDAQASAIDERKNLIAEQVASLLNLPVSLKTEMDETTKDTLSVTVVRRARAIEQLPHRMRMK